MTFRAGIALNSNSIWQADQERGQEGMRYEVKNVTPEMAKAYLASNFDHNRKLSRLHVNDLASAMRDGTYVSQNGQTIVVGADGTLYDGQHRMSAIVESGTTQQMLVCTLEESDDAIATFRSVDGGMKRMAATFIDRPYQLEKAAISRMSYGIEHGTAPLRSVLDGRATAREKVTSNQAVRFFYEHEEYMTDVATTTKRVQLKVGKGSPSMFATLVVLTRFVGRGELVDQFMADLKSDIPRSAAAVMLTNRMLRAYSGGKKPDNKWQLGILLDAYENYRAGTAKRLTRSTRMLDYYDRLMSEARGRGARIEMPERRLVMASA